MQSYNPTNLVVSQIEKITDNEKVQMDIFLNYIF